MASSRRPIGALVSMVVAFGAVVVAPASAATEVVETVRVSVASDGTQGNSISSASAISGDGTTIVYESPASNLVPGDTNGKPDVFAYDVATGTTTLISVASDGTQGVGSSRWPAISDDGSTIVYESVAWNLVPGDTNLRDDVFAYDVATATTTRISVASDGTQLNGHSRNPAISGDGATIVYDSDATNLDRLPAGGVFAYDVATGTTTRISVTADTNLPNGSSHDPAISDDGATIVYESSASNLVPGDTNGKPDVFAYDVATATTTLISVATDGTQGFTSCSSRPPGCRPAISGDGSTIVYESVAWNLVPGDTNLRDDVFAYDVATATTTRISVAANGTQGNGDSRNPAISDDGATIVYDSAASNLFPGYNNGFHAVLAYDVATATTTRISVATDGAQGNGKSQAPAISDDGATIVYESAASSLVPGDTNGFYDVFLTRVNRSAYDSFVDDDDSIFEQDIEWLASSGITRGCNPPSNDLFCPNSTVTRGQMAAFLHRALPSLPEVRPAIDFTDDDDSIFEADIEWLYSVGVTQGNSATTFNPNAPVTRGQMAAFLVRALKYTDNGGGDLFVDDDSSQFRGDIDRLGTAGVTRGCNPPTNDKFCPEGLVTRGQMAAFLHRALAP